MINSTPLVRICVVLAFFATLAANSIAAPITYQGVLNDNKQPANGLYDLNFVLRDAPTGGAQVGFSSGFRNVPVTNGLFTVQLDFGANAFNGSPRWLEIGVLPGGSPPSQGFPSLSPRQPLTAAPQALYATQAGSVVGGANQVIELRADSTRLLRLEPNSSSPNIIGGSGSNTVSAGVSGATIAGGGTASSSNRITGNFGAIGGGAGNVAASFATVAGGQGNTATGGEGAIGGGIGNIASGQFSTVPGGIVNRAAGRASFAAGDNAIADHNFSFVWSGAGGNPVSSSGTNQFVVRAPGGVQWYADTSHYFGNVSRQMLNLWGTNYAIGVQPGSLMFRCNDAASDGFIWYKGGGYVDSYANPGGGIELMHLVESGLYVKGALLTTSDRNAKQGFNHIEPMTVLDKVLSLPITQWSYKSDPTTRHIGPVAQDFKAAFELGSDEKHIATVDADGVALAAIQGLHQLIKEKDARIDSLEKRLNALERRVTSP